MTSVPEVRSVLVVCAANICRSPSAALLLAAELEARGTPLAVISAGVTAIGGRPPCDLALALVGRYAPRAYAFAGAEEVSVGGVAHRSRRLSVADASESALVVAMEQGQVDAVTALAPSAIVRRLDLSNDIPDPHAIGYQAHAMVFEQLRRAVTALADELAAQHR